MDNCIVCAKELDETYLINKYGDMFCSEECYDEFYTSPAAEGLTPDGDSAFYDQYRILRHNYIDWLSSWRSDLEKEQKDKAYAACKMFEQLDAVIWSIEPIPDDQPFQEEIMLYRERFRALQLEVMYWHPLHHEENYMIYMSSIDDVEKLRVALTEIGKRDLYVDLADHQHIFREANFVFNSQAERDRVYQEIMAVVDPDEHDLAPYSFFYCDGCDDDIADVDDSFGWALCPDCDYMAFYTREELDKALQFEVPEDTSRFDWDWMTFKIKIKRSCTKYGIDYPDWITIGPSFYEE